MKYLSALKEYIARFSAKGLSPSHIAFCIALGNFIGFIPVLGVHTIMAIGLAYLLRLNPVIVLLGTQTSNPLSFPFLVLLSAETGNFILYGKFIDMKFSKDIRFLLDHYVAPTFVGSTVLGIITSVLLYFLLKKLIHMWNRRKAGHEGSPSK
jgi:uncharacterized protein (DUF2062 family)